MATIPQRELRNNVSEVLRRAEAGERITITVDGRPVAELGPLSGARAPAAWSTLLEIIERTPVDGAWYEHLTRMREEDREAGHDPWRD